MKGIVLAGGLGTCSTLLQMDEKTIDLMPCEDYIICD